MTYRLRPVLLVPLCFALSLAWGASAAADLASDARHSLSVMKKSSPVANSLAAEAKGILVFPKIVKAGFMFGGQIGDGVLFENGTETARYNSVAASYGLQAGVQTFGYALLFMNADALNNFKNASGFEIGVGPSIVIIDKGVGKSATTTTMKADIYSMIFDQTGLMAGLGLQGSKITRIGK